MVGGAAAGELLFILEVMKTEVAHTAPVVGIVRAVNISVGDAVDADQRAIESDEGAMKLKDKVAIVTGASQGIGESIAKRYAKEGAKVAVNYSKSEDKANKVVADIRASGGQAKAFKADCSKVKEIEGLVKRVIEAYGTVDIVVNNAGVFRTVPVEETTEEIWDEQLDLNLKGAFFVVRSVLPEFRRKGRGKVINISSIFGTGAGPNCPAYCASKGGLVNLTKALAVELGRHNININSLAPGNIATPLNAHLRAAPEWNIIWRRCVASRLPAGIFSIRRN